MPAGSFLDLDSKDCIGTLPAYLAGVEDNEISLKLQKPLLTRWWHVNVCVMQVRASYKMYVNLFENLHDSCQSDRLRSIDQNGIALGKSKKIKCDGGFF